ncbi:Transcription-repair coupling factor [hydrothermal vent metagenome]|uniref:Transcription-repair coupling factor n=1 Tax=hydrothermal vent metagenome TaxID=652676 RepID=A0A3B1BT56_9ZZZZ
MISLFGLESKVETAGESSAPVLCHGLTKTSKALFIASLAERVGRPVVLVTDKAAKAEETLDSLRFFSPEHLNGRPLLYFPPWEILPYEDMSPYPEVSVQRLSTLARLAGEPRDFILVTSAEALALRTIPKDALKKSISRIDIKDSMDMEILMDHLVSYGLRRVDMVEERGEFSVRGGIIDVFASEADLPYRIELFGDEVESIRKYNPETQRSVEQVESVTMFPSREVFYEGVDPDILLEGFTKLCAKNGVDNKRAGEVAEALKTRRFFPGVERLSPLFFPDSVTLFDYLPPSTLFALDEPDDIFSHMKGFYALIDSAYEEALDKKEPVSAPESIYVKSDWLKDTLKKRGLLQLCEFLVGDDENGDGPALSIGARAPERYRGDVSKFLDDLQKLLDDGFSVALVASSAGGAERIERVLKEADLGAKRISKKDVAQIARTISEQQPALFDGNLFITVGNLFEGFIIKQDKWAIFTDDEIFGKIPRVRHRARKGRKAFSVGISELVVGDLIVHSTHGVGKYIGAKEMLIADSNDEYLELEYAGNQKLYLPITSVGLIKKYSGGGGSTPHLDKMGGSTWKKTRSKVKKSLLIMAEKLIKMQASRKLGEGISFSADTNFHGEFADTFEFEATEDQKNAIEDISDDMEKPKPMDRLVCGDVGYGKTEVAMRAAFKAVYDGKQVAVLVPTTLLAQQHDQTFTERFKSFPVLVESLSRFKSKKEQKDVLERMAMGEANIIIGTHRLLQKDVKFKSLGLVIIDEEQRFGVAHKEKLKNLARNVDLLTLTATPIPRTLHTSMVGIRDLSIIETPPQDRQAVRNFISKFSEKSIREAIVRELDRGGQVFFVHNKVRSIYGMADFIRRIVPQAKIAVAHGQMGEKELESVMGEFIGRQADILVCTTIIESGLDIPSANTIIINRADHFGLSQLYQLRGRVGRDRHRAYCYFLVPGRSDMTEIAKKRLRAMEELSELGSGFKLAARDMEIRGAGNIVGPQQSGQIDAVGFDTYCEMLEDAIREIKGEPSPDRFDVAMNLSFNGRISPDYVPDLNQRMDIHNRLAALANVRELDEMNSEMEDRFGAIPEETLKLLFVVRVRLLLKMLRVEKADMLRNRMCIVFHPSTKLTPDKIMAVGRRSSAIKFTSGSGAEFTVEGTGWRERYNSICDVLEALCGGLG